jgi:hypothetical protein
VGLDWQFAGVAPIHAAGASDLVLRNVNTRAFEVYDIAGNTLVGARRIGPDRGKAGLRIANSPGCSFQRDTRY